MIFLCLFFFMDKVIDGGLDGWRDELIFEGFGIIFIEDFEVLFKR